MSVTVRFDKDFLLDEWIALYRAADYNQWWNERNARAALVYAHSVTTGWLDGHAVGTLTVWSDGLNFAWLDDLAVHRDHRRRGIASRLVAETLARLTSAGVSVVQVMPIPGREEFCARHGFVVQENATVMDLTRPST